MKIIIERIKKWLRKLKLRPAIAGAAAALTILAAAPPARALDIYQPNTYVSVLTNGTVMIATATITNLGSITKPITVVQGKGISIFVLIGATNTATANDWFTFDVTGDGTNWTTTHPLAFAAAHNGTTGVLHWTNIPPSVLSNVRQIRVGQATNAHTATSWLTNMWFSYGNN